MCGLYGFIGLKPQPINITSFLALGVENDSRGGHGCGIFWDGKIEYGESSEKYFESFYEKSELLPTIKSAEILIGHDRKASVGGVSNEKLQPVVHYDDDANIDFVLMHNGTITNHTELAKKYLSMEKEESDKYTDSQIMCQIVYTHGFGVFAEYVGAGVFVMVDYRTPKRKPSVFVFKGKSKEHSYSKEAEEERPLYYIRTDNGLWFSSIASYLNIMCFGTESEVYTFPSNKVLLINNNKKLQLIEEIDRSELVQKPTTVTYYENTHKNVQSLYYGDDYDYEGYYCCGGPLGITPINNDAPLLSESTIKNGVDASAQIIPNFHIKGRMEHSSTFRYIDSESKVPLTGVYFVNKFGEYQSERDLQHQYKLFLFNGVPVYGNDVLSTIIEYCGVQTDCVNFDEMCQYFPEVIYPFSQWPYYDFYQTHKYYRFTDSGKQLFYTGSLVVPFGKNDDMCFEFADGDLVGSKHQKKNMGKFYKKYKILCDKDYEKMLHYLTV